jgi:N-acetylneuraminic acid mutarotase
MSDPHVYPEAPSAPLSLPAAVEMPTPTFTPIEQLAAADPSTPEIPKTMFIRVAMSGADCPGVTSATAPNFYLRADTGDAVLINDHTQPPNQTYPIFRRPGSNPADFVGEGSVFLESHNVFRLVMAFNDGTGDYAWRLGIWNNDAAAARQFIWIVSGTLANTSQPWIDVAPSSLSWDVLVGDSASDSVKVSNKGTGAFTVNGTTPALPAEFILGALPVTLDPNTSAPLTVTFTAPAAPPPPDGVITSAATVDIRPTDIAAGAAAGHNNHLSLSAHVSSPNTWATKAPMPTSRQDLGLAAAGNGKLYAVGGATMDETIARVEEYDPATDTWAAKAPMPTARSGLGLAAAGNGKLYAVGGFGGAVLATVEEYDPATDTWAAKAPMPTARSGLGLAASSGKLYAIGGFRNAASGSVATVEEYDPATDRWAIRAPMPTARHFLGLATARNGKLYAIGGFNEKRRRRRLILPTLEEYDTATDTWATKAPMPTARGRLGLASASNGKLYAMGGVNPTGGPGNAPFATVEEYDTATDTWVARASMPSGRERFGLAIARNGRLYAIGGATNILGAVATVEEYTP